MASLGKNEWDDFLKREFEISPKKRLTTILSEKLPKRFAEAFITHFFRELEDVFASGIAKKDREAIAKLLGE